MSGRRLITLSLAALASLPVLLYAVLGFSARMMADDYALFATALRLSGRHNFGYWWDGWFGSYSFILFNDLLAPLGAAAIPAIMPAVIVLSWLSGLTWLLTLVLRALGLGRDALPVSCVMAALTVGASVCAFPTWEALYYYAASARYAFPVGVLLLFLAWIWTLSPGPRSPRRIALIGLACAFFGFVLGGFSEMHGVYQLMALSLILIGALALGGRRSSFARFIAFAWLGSLASLVAQFLSPGPGFRLAVYLEAGIANPVSSLSALTLDSLRKTLEYLMHRESLIGFGLMLAAGLSATLLVSRARLARDNTQEAASPLESALNWRQAGRAAALFSALVVIAIVAPVAIGLRSVGIVYARVLTPTVLLQVLAGLIWGLFAGLWLLRLQRSGRISRLWLRRLGLVSLAVSAIIVAAIVIHQLWLLPQFARYAAEWDARHQQILLARERGERVVEVSPYSFDLTAYIAEHGESFGGNFPYFYDVDAILVAED